MTSQNSIIVVGGGLVGLATAYNYLKQNPKNRVTLLEKEQRVGIHQSGRNSGVLHSGIYYKPGSYRARLCVEGKAAMQQFCDEQGIGYDICGKVIVATREDEFAGLQAIYEKGQANGVKCEVIGAERLRELEPHCAGLKAIHVPEAGIADYPAVSQALAKCIVEMGGELVLGATVTGIDERADGVTVQSTQGDFSAETLITCAGLFSDRVAALSTDKSDVKIVPFRGEYYKLKPEVEHLCKGLIYPVPDPAFPFLGVHFTKMMRGGVDCGPNAILAWKREGYRKTDVDFKDLFDAVSYRGFQKLAFKYWPKGANEIWRSFNKRAFVRALQRLIPAIQPEHLTPIPAGVRAMALTPQGKMSDDFAFVETPRAIHVVNAPSPAATASLSIGKTIVGKLNHI